MIAILLSTAACSCPQSKVMIDDFEGCGGTCGWTISGAGQATIVSTILPGEHGMQMTGGITASKAIPPAVIDNSYSLELVADCPSGLAASLTASVPKAADLTLTVALAIDNALTSSGNPPDYSGASYVPLVGAFTLPTGVTSASVHQVTLEPAAGGTCTVDVVRLTATVPCGH